MGKALDYIIKHPTLPLSAVGTGLAAAGLAINVSRLKGDRAYQERQLGEMGRLTDSLSSVNKTINRANTLEEARMAADMQRPRAPRRRRPSPQYSQQSQQSSSYSGGFPKFKFKLFSSNTVDKALNGAFIGTAVGTILGGGGQELVKRGIKFVPGGGGFGERLASQDRTGKALMILGTSMLIGAGLGALIGAVQDAGTHWHNKNIGDQRVTKDLLKELSNLGLEEDRDFTRSPKTANLMRTKVCIMLKGDATEFNIVINSREDKNLKNTIFNITSRFRNGYQKTVNQANNNYNEITLTTIKDKRNNVKAVADIISKLVSEGYKVYLVEAG